jgi:acyl phosphate:glycerol-3-phosphate acyltransferase
MNEILWLDLLWIVIAFACGSLPFSVWVGRFSTGKDIRQVGDGNPGATNVFRAGGKAWGVAAVLLDMLKAIIPVGYVYWFRTPPPTDLGMVLIAFAPILGHAYSPFLGFKGGKAVATTGGSWIGYALYDVPIVGGLFLFYWYKSLKVSGWAVIGMMACVGLYVLLARQNAAMLSFWALNTALLAWKHREDLAQAPGLKFWWRKA